MNSAAVRVSVVLPTRDRVELLPRSLGSVLGQSERSLECIVVDDGSTDGTAEWLAAVDDPRVRVVRLEQSVGAAAARNRALELAAGRFVAFQDSDDEWLPDKLERQLAAFDASPPPAVVYCGLWVDRGGGHRDRAPAEAFGDPFTRMLAYTGTVTTPALVIDRAAAGEELRFDEGLPAMQEWDLLLRLARSHVIGCVSDPLYVWYQHGGQRVSNASNQARARRLIIDKYASDLATRPTIAAHHWWRLAAAQRRAGDLAGARASVAEAARIRRRQPRFWALHAIGRFGLRAFDLAWRAQELLERWRPDRRRR